MDGIIIVNKPKNYTSRDVVNVIGKKFQTKRVGHTGTLDPLATGVLVICLNKATKIAELITATDKEYVARFILGTLTDTLDITGKVIKDEKAVFKKNEIVNALEKMLGSYEQEVPAYSAVKVNGKKLYEYARNGEEITLPKHLVHINELELLEINYNDDKTIIDVRCLVSKGTYIRSLGNDIAKKLGTFAIMSSLNRTKQGSFSIESSYTIDDINADKYELLKINDVINYKQVTIDETLYNQIKNGMIIDNNYDSNVVSFNFKGDIVAIYKSYEKDNSKLKPWKMF